MKVRDIMTTGVECAAPDTSLKEIASMMKDEDVGAIPIVEGDELIGIVTDRDIVVRCVAGGDDPAETDAEEVLSGDLETVEADDDVEEASRIMAERQIRRLPVVEKGRLIGMISLGDVAVKQSERTAGNALEDISEGVKGGGGGKTRARRESALAESGKAQRGRGQITSISNRGSEEIERQQRVNPQRAAAGSSGRKRRKVS